MFYYSVEDVTTAKIRDLGELANIPTYFIVICSVEPKHNIEFVCLYNIL